MEASAVGGSWLTRVLVDGGAVRLVLVEAEELAEAVREAHDLPPDQTRLVAEANLATLMLSAYVKGEEKLVLQLALQQPEARYLGELDPSRRFRARLWTQGLGGGVEPTMLKGLLQAAKYVGDREVYRGITGIDHTSITDALRGHLVDSAQVHGALAVHVALDEDGAVTRARAVLAERLPEEDGKPSISVDAFASSWGTLGTEDVDTIFEGVAQRTLHGQPVHVLEQLPALWGCTCSKERVIGALVGLGADELRTMAAEDHGAVMHCEFCNARYELSEDEILELAASLSGG